MNDKERRQLRYIRRREKRQQRLIDFNKPYDNIEKVIDPKNMVLAFLKSKRGVSWKYSVQSYRLSLLSNINNTIQSVQKGIFPTKPYKYFQINERGKTRDIASPSFYERVFMKSLCDNTLVPVLSRPLIYDNGASRKGMGTGFTRKRLVHHLADYYKHNGSDGYVLSIDFTKYFSSINHDVLKTILKRYIKNPQIINMCNQAIDNFGPVGLGLGSQSSQIWAILYPNLLDHYVKEIGRNKYYGRYMDDIYIISNDKSHLETLLKQIYTICDKLKITINKKKTHITPLRRGVTFLHCRYNYSKTGKILKCGGKETCKRARHKLYFFKKQLDCGKMFLSDIKVWYRSWRGYVLQFDSREKLYNIDKVFNYLYRGI